MMYTVFFHKYFHFCYCLFTLLLAVNSDLVSKIKLKNIV